MPVKNLFNRPSNPARNTLAGIIRRVCEHMHGVDCTVCGLTAAQRHDAK